MWLDEIERENYMHAAIQATLYNAHFQTDGVPFTAAQILGKESRAESIKDARRQRLELFKFSRFMTSDPESLPDFVLELEANSKSRPN